MRIFMNARLENAGSGTKHPPASGATCLIGFGTSRLAALALVLGCLAFPVVARGGPKGLGPLAPLQLDQSALLVNTNFQLGFNWQSYRGVPISSVATNGSDGRYNLTNGPSIVPATTNQFQSFQA